MKTHSEVIQVVACIIEKNGKFLITKRLKHSHLGHLWEFPGGKLEQGESLEDCAIRECREEIDVEVRPVKRLQDLRHDYPEKSLHLYFMLCELVSGTPRAVECAEWCWAAPEEFSRFEFPEGDKRIIEEYIQKKR